MGNIIAAVLLLVMVLLPVNALAAKPVVKMANEVFTYQMDFNNIPLDENAKHRIWHMIHNRLLALQAEDDLPFELASETVALSHKANELAGDSDVYLIPAVIVNSAGDTSYSSTTTTYYNSAVTSGISLIFCVREENYDDSRVTAEGNSVTLRMFGIVPLVASDIIGVDKNDKRTAPISDYAKLNRFMALSQEALDGKLKFSSTKKNLKNEYARFSQDTYQVTDVKIRSAKARELFPGASGEDLKFLVAYNFTAAYQQKNKRLVYLPAFTNNSFAGSIARATNTVSLDSINGRVDIAMSNPAHRITLDITGANYKYYPKDKVIAYKVWLAKSPVEGDEKAELSRGYGRPLIDAGEINIDSAGVMRRMLEGLALELGGQGI